MIGTNRDLAKMREAIDYELLRLTSLSKLGLDAFSADDVAVEIAKLQREPILLCAAIVNRRVETARSVVSLARWASGNGALDALFSCRRSRAISGGSDTAVVLAAANSQTKGA